MNGEPPTVDVHTHLAPALDPDLLRVAGLPKSAMDDYNLTDRTGPPALHDSAGLLRCLSTTGVDRAVVSVPPPYYRQNLPATLAGHWARALNAGLARVIAPHDALRGFAYLPLQSPAAALTEYERVRTLPGSQPWIGWTAAAGGVSRLDDPALTPLWQRANDDRAVILLHPDQSPDVRLRAYYLANLLGNPVETAMAAAQLIFGGVLQRYAGIRFVLVHCGGVVPSVVARWQRGFDSARPGIDPGGLAPLDAARRLWVDALSHSHSALTAAIDVFGIDHVVLGSDWPFPMGLQDPATATAGLRPEDRERIARLNPAGLFRPFDTEASS
jgi:aminocarboxymuconate-semialdehyde decarboxylase